MLSYLESTLYSERFRYSPAVTETNPRPDSAFTKVFSPSPVSSSTAFSVESMEGRAKTSGDMPSIFSWLNSLQRVRLEVLLNSLSDVTGSDIQRKSQIIRSADLRDRLFLEENWLLYAFMGYQMGYLSSTELAMACHLDMFFHDFPDHVSQISTLSSYEGLTMVEESFRESRKERVAKADYKSLSTLERLVLPIKVCEEKRKDSWYELFATESCDLVNASKGEFLIISTAALQAILKSVSPDHFVNIFPVFGTSNKLDHWLGHPHLKPVRIECRFFSKVTTDGISSATSFDYTLYDGAYQAVMTSFDPFRDVEDVIAQFFLRKSRSLAGTKKGGVLECIALYFIDRSFLYIGYEPCALGDRQINTPECFMSFLLQAGTQLDYSEYVALIVECFKKSKCPFPIKTLAYDYIRSYEAESWERRVVSDLIFQFEIGMAYSSTV